jgi:hypothetical protein
MLPAVIGVGACMQFGVLQFFSWPGRRIPLPEVCQRTFVRIDIMERSGYDCVWLAEHHFSTYSVCPSIHMMGAHIAARTQRLPSARRCRWRRSTTRCGWRRKWRCSTCCP